MSTGPANYSPADTEAWDRPPPVYRCVICGGLYDEETGWSPDLCPGSCDPDPLNESGDRVVSPACPK